MKSKTLLITGGSGYLGRTLSLRATESFNLYTTYRRQPDQILAGQPVQLDITDREAVLACITKLKPDAIIHTAASNPGADEQQMMNINGNGSRYMAEGAVSIGARLVHLSTDVLHDGKNGPYADDALPTPLNTYSHSKAVAEAAVTETDPQAAIIRTSLIYGLQEMDRGTKGFVEHLQRGEPLVLFNDVLRQPVWVETLATATLKLTEVEFGGILNVAGRQVLTREAFGRRMLNYWQIKTGNLLSAGKAADVSAAIPLDLRMSITKGEVLLEMPFLGVDEVLAAYQKSVSR